MKLRTGTAWRTAVGIASLISATPLAAQTGACNGVRNCEETRAFVATITDFRTSAGGTTRVMSLTLHIQNKTSSPLTLGFPRNGGVGIDDQGNRYAVYENSVRGMGIITSTKFDPKFSLQPGESGDARFELGFRPDHGVIFGTSYALDLTVRQIVPVTATQSRLGPEYALHFAGLANGSASPGQVSAATAASSPAAPANAATAVTTGPSDTCAGMARCYGTTLFTAQVVGLNGAMSGRNHALDIHVRFHNISTQPLILGYHYTTSSGIDNLNNRYYYGRAGTHDVSVQGIGIVTSNSADPQFALQPGESRDATFRVTRYDALNHPLGTSFSYDVSIDQLEVLASQQVRTTRQYAMHFDNLTAGATPSVPNVGQAVNALRTLFGKKKK